MKKLVLVDKDNFVRGAAPRHTVHTKGLLHRSFCVYIYRVNKKSKMEMLIQKGTQLKSHNPGLWSNASCGHIGLYKDIPEVAKKKLEKEFGFSTPIIYCGTHRYYEKFEDIIENEIVYVYSGVINHDYITIDQEKIEEFRWVEFEELLDQYSKQPELFSKWFMAGFKIALPRYASESELSAVS